MCLIDLTPLPDQGQLVADARAFLDGGMCLQLSLSSVRVAWPGVLEMIVFQLSPARALVSLSTIHKIFPVEDDGVLNLDPGPPRLWPEL